MKETIEHLQKVFPSITFLAVALCFYFIIGFIADEKAERKAAKDYQKQTTAKLDSLANSFNMLAQELRSGRSNQQDSLRALFKINEQQLVGINRLPRTMSRISEEQMAEVRAIMADYLAAEAAAEADKKMNERVGKIIQYDRKK